MNRGWQAISRTVAPCEPGQAGNRAALSNVLSGVPGDSLPGPEAVRDCVSSNAHVEACGDRDHFLPEFFSLLQPVEFPQELLLRRRTSFTYLWCDPSVLIPPFAALGAATGCCRLTHAGLLVPAGLAGRPDDFSRPLLAGCGTDWSVLLAASLHGAARRSRVPDTHVPLAAVASGRPDLADVRPVARPGISQPDPLDVSCRCRAGRAHSAETGHAELWRWRSAGS